MVNNFISTDDVELVKELKIKGCKQITSYLNNGKKFYVLENKMDKELTAKFSNNEKIVFTDRLFI